MNLFHFEHSILDLQKKFMTTAVRLKTFTVHLRFRAYSKSLLLYQTHACIFLSHNSTLVAVSRIIVNQNISAEGPKHLQRFHIFHLDRSYRLRTPSGNFKFKKPQHASRNGGVHALLRMQEGYDDPWEAGCLWFLWACAVRRLWWVAEYGEDGISGWRRCVRRTPSSRKVEGMELGGESELA